MNDVDPNDWEVIETPPSFKMKSKLSHFYCKSRYIVSLLQAMYNNGISTVKLVNQLVWINYSMYPYLPPKMSLLVSVVIVCIFFMNIKTK